MGLRRRATFPRYICDGRSNFATALLFFVLSVLVAPIMSRCIDRFFRGQMGVRFLAFLRRDFEPAAHERLDEDIQLRWRNQARLRGIPFRPTDWKAVNLRYQRGGDYRALDSPPFAG